MKTIKLRISVGIFRFSELSILSFTLSFIFILFTSSSGSYTCLSRIFSEVKFARILPFLCKFLPSCSRRKVNIKIQRGTYDMTKSIKVYLASIEGVVNNLSLQEEVTL
ncbi:hypothetical protein V6Z11_D10G213000 [Gossypium hirsutum]